MPRSVTARSDRVRRALAQRQARYGQARDVPAGHVVWVYAITNDLGPDQLAGLTGVGGEPVRAVAEAGLIAVVGSVDARRFGEQARASLLSDLASIERLGRAHHQVIACVAADSPVLPLRLATVYPDDQTVRTLLGRDAAEFAVMLESFRGTEEWGVKVYLGAQDPTAQDPTAQDPTAQDACADIIDRALSGIAVATRHSPPEPQPAEGNNALVLHASYLLNSDRADEFTKVARALARAHEGARADLTGPWPPYSFADLHHV